MWSKFYNLKFVKFIRICLKYKFYFKISYILYKILMLLFSIFFGSVDIYTYTKLGFYIMGVLLMVVVYYARKVSDFNESSYLVDLSREYWYDLDDQRLQRITNDNNIVPIYGLKPDDLLMDGKYYVISKTTFDTYLRIKYMAIESKCLFFEISELVFLDISIQPSVFFGKLVKVLAEEILTNEEKLCYERTLWELLSACKWAFVNIGIYAVVCIVVFEIMRRILG